MFPHGSLIVLVAGVVPGSSIFVTAQDIDTSERRELAPDPDSTQAPAQTSTDSAAPAVIAVVVTVTIFAAIALTYFCCGWRVWKVKPAADVEMVQCCRQVCTHMWPQTYGDPLQAEIRRLERTVLGRRTNARVTYPRTYSEMGIHLPEEPAA
ncbi:hypothetical protein QBC47DRAFT_385030 [Echria macrotheca]|uniref:Uncharacterized protein n=1 Tax=Echria macrotheca TaxID=438768 RepID=A0AAJ0BB84_9PEZI|nr:hypothetical protein QBC47DRAFT_385030 [Echria macrotheca]